MPVIRQNFGGKNLYFVYFFWLVYLVGLSLMTKK